MKNYHPHPSLGESYKVLSGKHTGDIGVVSRDPNDQEKRFLKSREKPGASSKVFLVFPDNSSEWFNKSNVHPVNP